MLAITVAAAIITGTSGGAAASQVTATTPAPPGKVHAPPTDLKGYPKRPAPQVNPALWKKSSPAKAGEVIAVTEAKGLIQTTIYDGVQGENSTVLYQVLKAHGVSGLRDPATAAATGGLAPNTVNGLTSCAYGTARTFDCGSGGSGDTTLSHQIRWADGSCCTHPQVWFVDHTGTQWPVTTSTYEWNTAHGVDSYYTSSCPNYSGQYCVNVTDSNAGCSGWQGLTTITAPASNSYYMTSAKVQLNDYNGTCTVGATTYNYSKNANGYRQDACHEMGHALGMGHNTATNSCLYSTIQNSANELVPDSNDFTLIAQLYDDGN
jgi:hypothetical protein